MTDANGEVTFNNLFEVDTALVVSAGGYTATTQNISLSCDQPTSIGVALNPFGSLTEGNFRVTLTWGETPFDLDAHLTGPTSNSTGPTDETNRFHVYYFDPMLDEAELDVDDTDSFGPETITTTGILPGLYRYTVHNSSQDSPLANSVATVKLTLPDNSVRSFTPPANDNETGTENIWTVFEIIVDESGEISSVLPVNTYGTIDDAEREIRSRRTTTTGYGEVESGVNWGNLPSK